MATAINPTISEIRNPSNKRLNIHRPYLSVPKAKKRLLKTLAPFHFSINAVLEIRCIFSGCVFENIICTKHWNTVWNGKIQLKQVYAPCPAFSSQVLKMDWISVQLKTIGKHRNQTIRRWFACPKHSKPGNGRGRAVLFYWKYCYLCSWWLKRELRKLCVGIRGMIGHKSVAKERNKNSQQNKTQTC